MVSDSAVLRWRSSRHLHEPVMQVLVQVVFHDQGRASRDMEFASLCGHLDGVEGPQQPVKSGKCYPGFEVRLADGVIILILGDGLAPSVKAEFDDIKLQLTVFEGSLERVVESDTLEVVDAVTEFRLETQRSGPAEGKSGHYEGKTNLRRQVCIV